MDDDLRLVIEAAWRVLERTNFEGFKVERVLHEADISARTFYRHFADKDELLLALLRDEMSRAGRRLRATVAEASDPVAKVSVWIRAVIGAAGDPRRVARARLFSSQQGLFRRFPSELQEGTQLLMSPLRDALALGVISGDFPWCAPDRDAPLIYALVGGEMTQALAESPGVDIESAIDNTIAFVLRALGIAPGPSTRHCA